MIVIQSHEPPKFIKRSQAKIWIRTVLLAVFGTLFGIALFRDMLGGVIPWLVVLAVIVSLPASRVLDAQAGADESPFRYPLYHPLIRQDLLHPHLAVGDRQSDLQLRAASPHPGRCFHVHHPWIDVGEIEWHMSACPPFEGGKRIPGKACACMKREGRSIRPFCSFTILVRGSRLQNSNPPAKPGSAPAWKRRPVVGWTVPPPHLLLRAA